MVEVLGEYLDEQLAAARAVVQGVIGDDLIGLYLYGSAVASGLQRWSDIDLLAVVRTPLKSEDKRRLVDGLTPVSKRGLRPEGWRPVELSVVVESDVRPWRYPPRLEFQYGEWLHERLEAGDLEPERSPNADLAVLLTMVRAAGRAIVGPPPADILEPVPHEHVARAIGDEIDPLLEDLDHDTTNVLLTLARMWVTVKQGTITSKPEAAAWAADRLPREHRLPIERARAIYLGHEDDVWSADEAHIRAAAQELVTRIRAAGSGRAL